MQIYGRFCFDKEICIIFFLKDTGKCMAGECSE